MPTHDRTYALQSSYVGHWLLAGPQVVAIGDDAFQSQPCSRDALAQHFRSIEAGVVEPCEGEAFSVAGVSLTWVYARSDADGRLDLAAHYPTCTYLCTWAYARLATPSTRQVILELTAYGPADLWVNGVHIRREQRFTDDAPYHVPCQCVLSAGVNDILIRFEQVAAGDCPYAMALRYDGPSDGDIHVVLPSPSANVVRHQRVERIIDAAILRRDLYTAEDVLVVNWPEDMLVQDDVCIRVQKPTGEIFAQAIARAGSGIAHQIVHAYELPDGHYLVRLMPIPEQYYAANLRTHRDLEVHTLRHKYTAASDGSLSERAVELLKDAAQRHFGIYAEIARMALGWWSRVDADAIRSALARVNAQADGSHRDLLGLLRIRYVYANDDSFPQELVPLIDQVIVGYRYWTDAPAAGISNAPTDSTAILFHTCQVLAGQFYADHVFETTAKAGCAHEAIGKQQALDWLSARARQGFSEWDSQQAFSDYLLALIHLVDFTNDETLFEMATVITDKLLFTLAVNSFKGIFGSTHATTSAYHITDARLEPTSPISYLLWGAGCLNPHIATPVSLACSQYAIPTLIQSAATELPEAMWARERHLLDAGPAYGRNQEMNKVTFKTPDYMLCSVQDFRKGEEGGREHVWQATLGPDVVVFTTHPACMSQSDAYIANFWRGNRRLPRVAQWRDVLIAIYTLPSDDPLGFTHARFPSAAFDEYTLYERWAFARKGDGYIALFASGGIEHIIIGPGADRELRSFVKDAIWLCQMGRAAIDGSFEAFQEKMLALAVDCIGTEISCTSIRGDTLQFGWQGDLLVNGDPQPLTGFPHYENPYCVTELGENQMSIRAGEWEVNLDLAI